MTEELIFSDALAIADPSERAAFLGRVCLDPIQRLRVEELLMALAQPSPLDHPPADLVRTSAWKPALADSEPTASVGDRVGRYKLLEKIGEGGMGEVWVADQLEPIRRRVALKLIKPGMDSRSVLGRFEAERQALAVMDHPNIAKVLDAGTTADGRPYFVMELVKGTPITEFCDARRLTPTQRLELFIPVCQAIQHAHLKGIIHRDVKPSNVLVALHDETPVPKVIDFGVAKAVGQQLTEKTIYTGFGALIGTPAYMAPEQATFNQLDVDTRADVYALGVLLYELLAGSLPIEKERLKKAALDEVLRIVRDEEPPRPSQRLSTSETKASIAATRQSDPAKLSALMRGEIDWIVMKALEKDRNRRYETANGLAKDIQRYLLGDSVEARPQTLGYRLRKFVRRNKGQVLAASLILLVLLAGLITTGWQAQRAESEAMRARAEEERARQARDVSEVNQQKAEVALVRSFLRPIGFQTEADRFDPAELNALQDAAALPGDRLRLLCFEEALRDPETAFRVTRRAERFVQATVGSSPARRRAALEFTKAIQHDPKADERIRLAACWLAIELHSDDWTGFEEGVKYLTGTYLTGFREQDWINFMSPTLRSRLSTTHAGILADALVAKILSAGSTHAPFDAFRWLQLIAPSLDPATATQIAETLMARRYETKHGNVPEVVADLLPVFAPRMATARVDRLIEKTLPDLVGERELPIRERERVQNGLRVITSLSPWASDLIAEKITESILFKVDFEDATRRVRDTWVLDILAATMRKPDPQLTRHVVKYLLLWLDQYSVQDNMARVGAILKVYEPLLEPADARQVAEKLLRLYQGGTVGDDRTGRVASQVMQILTNRIDAENSHDIWSQIVNRFSEGKFENTYSRSADLNGWVPLIGRMPARSAEKIAIEIIAKMGLKPSEDLYQTRALELLALRFEPPVAMRVADELLVLLQKTDLGNMSLFARILAPMLQRLPQSEAQTRRIAAFEGIASRLQGAPNTRAYGGRALAALVRWMPEEIGNPYRMRAVRITLELIRANLQQKDGQSALRSLEYLLPILDAESAKPIADFLLDVIHDPARSEARNIARKQLVAIAPYLDHETTRLAMKAHINATFVDKLDPESDADLLENAYRVAVSWKEGARLRMREVGTQHERNNALESELALLAIEIRLKPLLREERLQQHLLYLLDEAVRSTKPPAFLIHDKILAHITDSKRLAVLLDHPGCIGVWRTAILHRLEDLLLPIPDFNPLPPMPALVGPIQMLTGLNQVARERTRRFRTAWDVAEWRERNRSHEPR